MKIIDKFSKKTKAEKLSEISKQLADPRFDQEVLKSFWSDDIHFQKRFDDFSENTISNFPIPYGIVPNILINGNIYHVPMVVEESSVVAAASKSAKFWLNHQGVKAKVISSVKSGQVHFTYDGDPNELRKAFDKHRLFLMQSCSFLTSNMERRGGGLVSLELLDLTDKLENLFQLELKVKTCNAMGANFINSLLEHLASTLPSMLQEDISSGIEVIMSILTNYCPESLVHVELNCRVEDLECVDPNLSGHDFARRFHTAVEIARVDTKRAVTHNKGIMNGIDAVVVATGNDFRAVEAQCHAYAARSGAYRSLSQSHFDGETLRLEMTLPLTLGTVGGLTKLHPLAESSLALLGDPSAEELMQICAAVGLYQNFAAVRSLVTTGIQQGHMRMHLFNILNQLDASSSEVNLAKEFFHDKVVSFHAVRSYLSEMRETH